MIVSATLEAKRKELELEAFRKEVAIKVIRDFIVLYFKVIFGDIVDRAYVNNSSTNTSLSYSIILKEDNIKNRSRIFDIYDMLNDFSNDYNAVVKIYIVPKDLEDEIKYSEELLINKPSQATSETQ